MSETQTEKGGGYMYPNVIAEIKRAGLTLADVASKLGLAQSTFSQKLNGKFSFTFAEAKRVKEIINEVKAEKGITINVDLPLEVLFEEAR
jgi:transcriptional regulator with XRE-family HTH domain